ncbi:MAG: Asp23/Gls24 family envelope stress response protein [Anaerolineae bacterium]
MSQDEVAGHIHVSPQAIATLASMAVMQTYGVVGVTTKNLAGDLAEILQKDSWRRGVEVHMHGDEIVIDLYVVLEYGIRFSEVAYNIMSNVKYTVERALGVPIRAVNVHIQGVRMSSRS